jgi:hypothetical protein
MDQADGRAYRGQAVVPVDGTVEFDYYADRPSALEAETAAIRAERPVHNIQHNHVRITVEIEAEVPEFNLANVFALLALVSGGLLAAKWAADFLANWWVKRQGVRQGVPVQIPPVVNPFTQDSPSGLQQFFYAMMTATTLASAQDNRELLRTMMPMQETAWLTKPLVPPAPAE